MLVRGQAKKIFLRENTSSKSHGPPMKNKILLTLGGCLLLTGCVSSNLASSRIKAFADATTLVTSNTKNAFDTVEQKYFEVQVLETVADYDAKGFHPEKFKPLFPPETRQVRDDTLDAFATYAQKLSDIMGNAQLDKFDQETKGLGAKLEDVSATISKTEMFSSSRKLSGNEIKIVTTAVEAFGNWFIRIEREKGVRRIVSDMDTNVAVLCSALTNDLHTLRKLVADEYSQGEMAENQFIEHGNLDAVTKRAEIQSLARMVVEAREADATFAAMEKSVMRWRQTHAMLVDVFSKKPGDIDSIIRQLIAEGQRVKKFYDSLDKK